MEFQISFGGKQFDPRDRKSDDEPDTDATSWIVQFVSPLTTKQIETLRAKQGLQLVDFVPDSTYIERMSADKAHEVESSDLVRTVVPYKEDLKVSPTVEAFEDELKPDEPGAVAMEATLFADADAAATGAKIASLDAIDVRVFDDRTRGGAPLVRFVVQERRVLRRVSRLEDVRWIEPLLDATDDSPGPVPQAAIGSFGPVWDRGVHGEGQVIAVVDAGPFDMEHCFFQDEAPNAPGPSHRKIVALRNKAGTDPGRHATFVAGCAAGEQFDDPGTHPRCGGAWAAKLVCGNRLDLKEHSTVYAELDASAASGATIHSNSWHLLPPEGRDRRAPMRYDATCAQVDRFTWLNEDHLVVCSAGNSDEIQGPPGIAKNTLCVAASKLEAIELGDGSAGPTRDGRRRPDVMLVGCGVISAEVDSGCKVARRACASSYATPYAAAAAALVRQYLMEGRHPSGEPSRRDRIAPTGALLKAILVNSTTPPSNGSDFPSDTMGWGLVDLRNVLFLDPDERRMHVWDVRNADGLAQGDVARHGVTVVDGAERLRMTLVWTDPPGTVGADDPVVNDLDLEATSPSGHRFVGNAFQGGVSVAGGDADARNNVELVLVADPEPGEWKLAVHARRVNVGSPGQGFALVTSGRLSARTS